MWTELHNIAQEMKMGKTGKLVYEKNERGLSNIGSFVIQCTFTSQSCVLCMEKRLTNKHFFRITYIKPEKRICSCLLTMYTQAVKEICLRGKAQLH